ncbi:helix-turn-helix transcriptional regulator [Nocardiopsis rhodophaea]|uniref:Helix-turn-helix transcriptional regulator n=1 Tax=Nocardiopsis rhodophaea TaxID=280238 RepID=A0ABN2TBN4_9ACTN
MGTPRPSALWLPFAAELRQARTGAGFTVERLAAATGASPELLDDAERARRRLSRTLVTEIDAVLGTGRRLARAWAAALQSEAFPHTYTDLRALEVHASRIREWEVLTVPVYLRTPGYARAHRPPLSVGSDPDRIEGWIEEQRRAREALTGAGGPELHVIIDEPVLSLSVGGPGIHAAQLDTLGELMDSAAVDLCYVPMNTLNHPGLGGSFRIMDFADRPSLASVYSVAGIRLVAEEEDLRHFERLWERLGALSRPLTWERLDGFKRVPDHGT